MSAVVLAGVLDLPSLPRRLVADCEREIASRLCLEAGDVEALSLARARARWPGHRGWVQAASNWMQQLGLQEAFAAADPAFMACRGARCHHDGERYGDSVFCNLFVSEDKGLDVHFPSVGRRVPLVRGTIMLFDTFQPHAVIRRGAGGFEEADFGDDRDCTQLFLTWEIAAGDTAVARLMGTS